LRREFGSMIVAHPIAPANPAFADAEFMAEDLIRRFHGGEFDACTLVYNRFLSALRQEVTRHRLIPFTAVPDDFKLFNLGEGASSQVRDPQQSIYEYEPSQEDVLASLLPTNMKIQLFRAILENTASEHGARMSAMDGATRNANDMIRGLTLTFNRTRQAYITKELIEIISGADAL
jgi:F-type H+-transporting ATPase subunit gamma